MDQDSSNKIRCCCLTSDHFILEYNQFISRNLIQNPFAYSMEFRYSSWTSYYWHVACTLSCVRTHACESCQRVRCTRGSVCKPLGQWKAAILGNMGPEHTVSYSEEQGKETWTPQTTNIHAKTTKSPVILCQLRQMNPRIQSTTPNYIKTQCKLQSTQPK